MKISRKNLLLTLLIHKLNEKENGKKAQEEGFIVWQAENLIKNFFLIKHKILFKFVLGSYLV